MNRDPRRNGLRLPLVAPLAIIEPAVPEIIPDATDGPRIPVPYGLTDLRNATPTNAEAPLPDPYEVAYLRGGGPEVTRLCLFDLVQRGYLEIIETRKWLSTERRLAPSRNAPPYEDLTATGRGILNWFTPLMSIDEALKLHTREPLASDCERYRASLEADGLFASADTEGWRTAVYAAGFVACFVLYLAGWQLVAVGAAVTASMVANGSKDRLSESGKRRLADLESRFSPLRDRPRSARPDVADPSLVTAVAIFGTAILADSPYDAFAAAVGPSSGWSFSVDAGGGCDGDGCGGCGGCCG